MECPNPLQIRKSRINKVSDARYISDVVFLSGHLVNNTERTVFLHQFGLGWVKGEHLSLQKCPVEAANRMAQKKFEMHRLRNTIALSFSKSCKLAEEILTAENDKSN